MMNHQVIVRNMRSKGLTLKQVLEFVLLLVVGIWVLYQIKFSKRNHHDTTLNLSGLKQVHGSNALGRKGTGTWSDNFSYSDDLYPKEVYLMAENKKKEFKESRTYGDSNIVTQEYAVNTKKGVLNEELSEKKRVSAENEKKEFKESRFYKDGNIVTQEYEVNTKKGILKKDLSEKERVSAENEKKEFKQSSVYEDGNIDIQEHEENTKKGMLKDLSEKERVSAEGVEGKIKDPRMNKKNITAKHPKRQRGSWYHKGKRDFLLKNGALAKENNVNGGSHSYYDENGVPEGPND